MHSPVHARPALADIPLPPRNVFETTASLHALRALLTRLTARAEHSSLAQPPQQCQHLPPPLRLAARHVELVSLRGDDSALSASSSASSSDRSDCSVSSRSSLSSLASDCAPDMPKHRACRVALDDDEAFRVPSCLDLPAALADALVDAGVAALDALCAAPKPWRRAARCDDGVVRRVVLT